MKRWIELVRQSLLWRALTFAIIGAFLGWAFSEVAFFLQRDQNDHQPSRIELMIPAGTADQVAAGKANPALPPDMSFVIGDVLVVNNQDAVSHQLGPLWIPPGASASLAMESANKFAYACTFQPTKYLGLDVRPRVTTTTRIQAIFLAGLPMGAMLFAYSFAAWPMRSKKTGT